MPQLSVHIATRNNAKYIKCTLDSLFADSFRDLEICIIDDDSTDNSLEVIDSAVKGHPNVKISRAETNLGVAKARQRLLESCSSEYILIIDGDDVHIPGTIAPRVDFMNRNPSCGAAYGKLRRITEAGDDLHLSSGLPFSTFYLAYGALAMHSGTMARRSAMVKAGGYLETNEGKKSLSEDYYLWLRMALDCKFKFFNRHMLLYRTHPTQTTTAQSMPRFHAAWTWIMNEVLKVRLEITSALTGSGTAFNVTDENRNAVLLTLGILSKYGTAGSTADVIDGILSSGIRTDMSDYGALFCSALFAKQTGNHRKSLALCAEFLERFGSDVCLRRMILPVMKENMERMNANPAETAAIGNMVKSCVEEYEKIDQAVFSLAKLK